MQTYYSLLRKDLLSEKDYLRITKRITIQGKISENYYPKIANCGITIRKQQTVELLSENSKLWNYYPRIANCGITI